MMQRKALCFDDLVTATEIMLTDSPQKCKALGQQILDFDDAIWNMHKFQVVEEGSYHKFMHAIDPEEREVLKRKLLATGERELVEASRFDRVWGVGFTVEELRRTQKGERRGAEREKWGQNLLGKALMSARKRIREEEEQRK
jgi:ribA/ribD-fused uncharacterized protein